MRIEGVPDAAAIAGIDGHAQRRGALADCLPVGFELRFADAILVHDVFARILAFERYLRIQFERLQVDVRLDAAIEFRQCLLQAGQPDRAPRASDVGNEVDSEAGRSIHGDSIRMRSSGCGGDCTHVNEVLPKFNRRNTPQRPCRLATHPHGPRRDAARRRRAARTVGRASSSARRRGRGNPCRYAGRGIACRCGVSFLQGIEMFFGTGARMRSDRVSGWLQVSNAMTIEVFYSIGIPGQPWGDAEKSEWRSRQRKQRSYADDVLRAIDGLRTHFDVVQYGELDYAPDRYPLFALKARGWNDSLPIMLVTGGVHGYETSGVRGALLFAKRQADDYAGRANVMVVPCVSPWGYERILRWNPYALDPNRNFIASSPAPES